MVTNRLLLFLVAFNLILSGVVLAVAVSIYRAIRHPGPPSVRTAEVPWEARFRAFGRETEARIELAGDRATLLMGSTLVPSLQKSVPLKALRRENRLILYRPGEKPDDGFIFTLSADSQTLDCIACEQIGLPRQWERID